MVEDIFDLDKRGRTVMKYCSSLKAKKQVSNYEQYVALVRLGAVK